MNVRSDWSKNYVNNEIGSHYFSSHRHSIEQVTGPGNPLWTKETKYQRVLYCGINWNTSSISTEIVSPLVSVPYVTIHLKFPWTVSINNTGMLANPINRPPCQYFLITTISKPVNIERSYKPYVSFWLAEKPGELADGSTLYVRCQGKGILVASSVNPMSLSLCKWLVPSLKLENFTGQKLINDLYWRPT